MQWKELGNSNGAQNFLQNSVIRKNVWFPWACERKMEKTTALTYPIPSSMRLFIYSGYDQYIKVICERSVFDQARFQRNVYF